MKTKLKVIVAVLLTAVMMAGFVSTAQAEAVGLAIYEQILPDGTPTAWAVWTSDPGAPIAVWLSYSGPEGRIWQIDLTDSGHQVDGGPQVFTWTDINSPDRWNNLYWDDPWRLRLESQWPTMADPSGFDNGVSVFYGFDYNGDDVYASVTKLPVLVDPCAAGFSNAYVMHNWTTTGIQDGVAWITPSSGPAGSASFSYDVNLGYPGPGVDYRTATFQTTGVGSRTFSFNYDFSGFHAYFATFATLQVFADGPWGTEVITLVDGGVGASFAYSGSASIQTHHGFPFGFIVGGSNYDYISILQGNLTISNVNGDFDNDTVADSCDLCPGHDDKADIDFDHIADGCDQCSLVGDINCDGAVNLEDLALMAGNWLVYN